MADTNKQFDEVTAKCRTIFVDKMQDYGASWRIFRLHGITDQLYIKACNIRQRQETGVSLVGDDIEGNLRAIVNYGITAIIQEREGYADGVDMTNEEAMKHYDKVLGEAKELMRRHRGYDFREDHPHQNDLGARRQNDCFRRRGRQLFRYYQLRDI